MRFFIVDDSASIRAMLANIIEEDGLGTVAGEAEDGSEVYVDLLERKDIDILLIDLLMPNRDGLETVKEITASFQGKIIMISQVETKEMIGEAYSLGVEYYVTKPINRLEVIEVLKKVIARLTLEKSLHDIHKFLGQLDRLHTKKETAVTTNKDYEIIEAARNILFDLGMIGESCKKDLLDLVWVLYCHEKEGNRESPSLKELYRKVVEKRIGRMASQEDLIKEAKAGEQRIRRAIHGAMEHLASLGLTDFTNQKFENYSSKFFDYSQVRMKMLELEGKTTSKIHHRINIKKFLHALYTESKQAAQR